MKTRLGQKIMSLLRQGREETVAGLAISDRRALRPLMGRLWDPDPRIRRHAAGAMGRSAEAHPTLGLEMVRRLMWALNDEAATNGVFGIAALGEIGHRCPEILEPFISPLVSMAWDEGIRLELLKALGRVAEADPRLVRRDLARLEAFVDESQEEERDAFQRLVALAGESNRERN
jgi:HEAT repeat protein